MELKLSSDPTYKPIPGYAMCDCEDCELLRLRPDYRLFLSAFYQPWEIVHYRAFPPKKNEIPMQAFKLSAPSSIDVGGMLFDLNSDRHNGIYFVVNSGGDKDDQIKRFTSWFVECDCNSLEIQNMKLDKSPIRPSIRVETRKSIHAYWLINGYCNADEWRDIQLRLIQHFDSDKKIKNPSRVMRLPFFDHINTKGERKKVTVGLFHAKERHSVKDMQSAFPPVLVETPKILLPHTQNLTGWEKVHELTRQAIKSHYTYRERGSYGHCQGLCHNGKGPSAIFLYLPTGAYKCMNGCDGMLVREAFGVPVTPDELERKNH